MTKQIAANVGESIPSACEDWANTKAVYRFFSNPNISEEEILEGHFKSTASRAREVDGYLLVLHDTTEVNYKQRNDEGFGKTRTLPQTPKAKDGRTSKVICGVLMHSSLVINQCGVPLGFVAKKFWNRSKFKGVKEIYRKKNATRIPIEEKESFRWIDSLKNSTERLGDSNRLVHIGNREADIYEFFHEAERLDSNYLVRIKVDRKLAPKSATLRQELEKSASQGKGELTYRDEDGLDVTVVLDIKFITRLIRPSEGLKSKRYGEREVTRIQAKETSRSGGNRGPIDWRIMTNLPVSTLEEALEKLHWYSLRWKVETFFKVLKSGFKIEQSKLKSAEAICKLISICSIVAWRIFWTTMLIRDDAKHHPYKALTKNEVEILDQLVPDKDSKKDKSLADYLIKIARLGGYLARKSDPPPGNIVIWRGLRKLIEIQRGFEIAETLVGN